MADMHRRGRGVARNELQAGMMIRRAAEGGDPMAMAALGRDYIEGRGVPRDVKAGVDLIRRAAESGEPQAMVELGLLHEQGEWVSPNPHEALRLYERAASLDCPRAMTCLAAVYYYGRGVPADRQRAIELLGRASARTFPPADELLAMIQSRPLKTRAILAAAGLLIAMVMMAAVFKSMRSPTAQADVPEPPTATAPSGRVAPHLTLPPARAPAPQHITASDARSAGPDG
jgi:hypothetical protein